MLGEVRGQEGACGSHGTVARSCPCRRLCRNFRTGQSTRGWIERRGTARQDGASWGPQPEVRRPRKGRGPNDSPARRPSSRATSASFGENVRSSGRGPSTLSRRGLALAREGGDGPKRRLTAKGPTRRMSRASRRGARHRTGSGRPRRHPNVGPRQSRGKGVLAA